MLILMIIFYFKGMKKLRLIFYRNIPTESRLKELIRKRENRDNYRRK